MATVKRPSLKAAGEENFSVIIIDKEKRIAEWHGGLLMALVQKPLRKGLRLGGILQQLGYHDGDSLLRAAIVRGKTSMVEMEVSERAQYISMKVEPIVKQGMVDGAMVTFADITLQKKNEAFGNVNAQMANLSLLAKKVSHRLNNPLATILNQIGSLLLGDLTEDSQKLRRELSDIQDQVYGLSLITNALDVFARDVAAANKLVQVNAVLEKAIELARLLNAQDNVKYRLKLQKDLPAIRGNEISLEQCFLHLLRNAQEAIPTGGNIYVQSRIKQQNSDFIEIIIKDDGNGIAKEDLLRVYEPFFTTKGGDHLGLGLCVSYSIVAALRGYIDIDSNPDSGTVVTISLPIAKTISKRG